VGDSPHVTIAHRARSYKSIAHGVGSYTKIWGTRPAVSSQFAHEMIDTQGRKSISGAGVAASLSGRCDRSPA